MTQIDAADKISMPETRREYLTIDEVKRLIATPCYRERVKQAYLSAVSAASGTGTWRN